MYINFLSQILQKVTGSETQACISRFFINLLIDWTRVPKRAVSKFQHLWQMGGALSRRG